MKGSWVGIFNYHLFRHPHFLPWVKRGWSEKPIGGWGGGRYSPLPPFLFTLYHGCLASKRERQEFGKIPILWEQCYAKDISRQGGGGESMGGGGGLVNSVLVMTGK